MTWNYGPSPPSRILQWYTTSLVGRWLRGSAYTNKGADQYIIIIIRRYKKSGKIAEKTIT
jgi:hypothetical protein